jgi:predicted transposase YbfD/YdcC
MDILKNKTSMTCQHHSNPEGLALKLVPFVQGELSNEQRYYITSHEGKTGEFIANAIRSHWSVENKLHWQLDVSFNEDKNRLRSGYAAENLSLMNKVALNLLKNESSVKLGVKNKRLKAGWDNGYMLKVLTVGLLSV